jgi:RNA polymerase sigma factor (TIGR02999 family)
MDITRLLARWSGGDPKALAELMPLVYNELRVLAASQMREERADHTLQPTALVHEAYLRLAGHRAGFRSRIHFYGAAAQAMRRILVDYARSRAAVKRGQREPLVDLDRVAAAGIDRQLDLVALDEALDRLTAVAPRAAKVVELRFFGGLSVEEAAAFLDISPATVKRQWSFARAWLYRALGDATPQSNSSQT